MSETSNPGVIAPRAAALHWRLLALIYDLFPVGALWFAGSAIVYALHGLQPVQPGSWAARLELVWLLTLAFGYYAISWRRGGQTLGMRAWRLRLVGVDDRKPGWSALLARWLLAWPSLLLAGSGWIAAWFDPHRDALHDRWSSTRVLRLPKG